MKKIAMIVILMLSLPVFAGTKRHVCGTIFLQNLHKTGVLPKLSARIPRNISVRAEPAKSYKIGDQHSFWTYDLSVMPPKNVEVAATCRAVGTYAYVFVADDQWGTNVDQSKVDALLNAFDTRTPAHPDKGIFETDTSTFGDPPDMDGDPKVILFVYKINGYGGYTFDGFFRPQDEAPFDADCETNPKKYCSNETEILHLNTKGIGGDYMNGVIAHEFQHLIHYNYDRAETTWLNEGMSELAMTINGYEDKANLDGFTKKHDVTLIPVGQQVINYGAVMLFGVYLYENTAVGTIKKLVADKEYGIPSVETQLMANRMGDFTDFFAYMATATLLDTPLLKAFDLSYKDGFASLDFVKPDVDATADMTTGMSGAFQSGFDLEPYTFKFVRLNISEAQKGRGLLLENIQASPHQRLCVAVVAEKNINTLPKIAVTCARKTDFFADIAKETNDVYLILANADMSLWSKPSFNWSFQKDPLPGTDGPEYIPDQAITDTAGSENINAPDAAQSDRQEISGSELGISDLPSVSDVILRPHTSGGSCCTSTETPETRNSWFFLAILFLAGVFFMRFRPFSGSGRKK